MDNTDCLTTKLSTACCVIRSIKSLYSPFHTVLIYGIIFWGNSIHSVQIFRMQWE